MDFSVFYFLSCVLDVSGKDLCGKYAINCRRSCYFAFYTPSCLNVVLVHLVKDVGFEKLQKNIIDNDIGISNSKPSDAIDWIFFLLAARRMFLTEKSGVRS